ncbi:MAG TPA: SIS domain-containing protein [Actinomycetota bacterium]|nr:SIS domain-containing protein [Actinomycetota bacterium]
MSAELFLRDLEAKPSFLRSLAARLRDRDPWAELDVVPERVVAFGLGSSRSAAVAATDRLRAGRIDAVTEYAGTPVAHPGGAGTLAVGVSASGRTAEVVATLERHRRRGSTTVAVTNDADAPIGDVADVVVPLGAGTEEGGVACRTFQHTLVLLGALVDRLTGAPEGRAAVLAGRSADATEDLLATRAAWLDEVTELLAATGQLFTIAPASRLSSAEQGALMFREGPRLTADACETADWSHVDVYLTKTVDYRALLFTGSPAQGEVMRWAAERGSTVVAVGADVPGAASVVRYAGDDRDDVALVTEVLVPELVAASAWAASGPPG